MQVQYGGWLEGPLLTGDIPEFRAYAAAVLERAVRYRRVLAAAAAPKKGWEALSERGCPRSCCAGARRLLRLLHGPCCCSCRMPLVHARMRPALQGRAERREKPCLALVAGLTARLIHLPPTAHLRREEETSGESPTPHRRCGAQGQGTTL